MNYKTDGDAKAEWDRKVARFLEMVTNASRDTGVVLDLRNDASDYTLAEDAIDGGDISIVVVPRGKHSEDDKNAAWHHFKDDSIWWQK